MTAVEQIEIIKKDLEQSSEPAMEAAVEQNPLSFSTGTRATGRAKPKFLFGQ